jgi:hypothetical protein
MGVVQRQRRAVLVIIDERRFVRAAAEDAGPDEIAEGRAEHVGTGEPAAEPPLALDQVVVLHRVQNQQHRGQDLDERDMLPIGTHMAGPPTQ